MERFSIHIDLCIVAKFTELFEIRLIFMKIALVVLIGLVLEIFVWIGVGDLVGSMWYVFFWFIAAFFFGLNLIRANSQSLMPKMQQMQMGQLGGADPLMGNNLPKIIAGVLLVIPGLITDVLALLILLPPVQNLFKRMFMQVMMKKQQDMMNNMMGGMGGMGNMGGAAGQNPFADLMRQMQDMQNQQGGGRYSDSNVIDGEAHEVNPDHKQIELKDVNKR